MSANPAPPAAAVPDAAANPPAAVSAIEQAKAAAARRAVAEHFQPSFTYVGIGSGTTVVHVVAAIASTPGLDRSRTFFIPTGYQSRMVITNAGLTALAFDALPEGTLMDVCFDGADEVDEELNCIKGGGACLYQEKLVATHAKKFVCVADHRKLQKRLLTAWPGIPVEVEPLAYRSVTRALVALGCTNPLLRMAPLEKSGPVKTDQGLYLIDAQFPALLLEKDVTAEIKGTGEKGVWEVNKLAREIKQIEGVLSVGIFAGPNGEELLKSGATIGGARPVIAYFGMADGSVSVRAAE